MKNACIIFFLAASVLACKKPDGDEPVINYVHANGINDDHLHGIAGTENSFEVSASDNIALSQMKLQFLKGGSIHTHSEGEDIDLMELTFQEPNFGAWDTVMIYNLSGTNAVQLASIPIPDTLSGGWVLRVGLLDAEGNFTSEDHMLHIANDDIPSILPDDIVPGLGEDGIVIIEAGGSIQMTGDIVDTDSLALVSAELIAGADTTWSQEWTNIDNWTFPMQQIVVPAITTEGNYLLYIHATDLGGFTNWRRVRIIAQ